MDSVRLNVRMPFLLLGPQKFDSAIFSKPEIIQVIKLLSNRYGCLENSYCLDLNLIFLSHASILGTITCFSSHMFCLHGLSTQ